MASFTKDWIFTEDEREREGVPSMVDPRENRFLSQLSLQLLPTTTAPDSARERMALDEARTPGIKMVPGWADGSQDRESA